MESMIIKLEDVLQELKRSLSRDYISSGIIGLDGIHLAFDSIEQEQNGLLTAAELADAVKDVMEMVGEIKSGRLYYINIATTKVKTFLFPIGSSAKYFCLLIIKVDGNVGKAILQLEKVEKLLRKNKGNNSLTCSRGYYHGE